MRLNIGQGRTRSTLDVILNPYGSVRWPDDGWKHIDICDKYQPDECYDVTNGLRESDSSVPSIWMGDVLEHFPRNKVKFVLTECHRVLHPGGTMLVSVPDMHAVMLRWLERHGVDAEESMPLSWLIWGEQDESGAGANAGPDTHRSGFTEASLSAQLKAVGFASAERTSVHGVWYELAMLATKGN